MVSSRGALSEMMSHCGHISSSPTYVTPSSTSVSSTTGSKASTRQRKCHSRRATERADVPGSDDADGLVLEVESDQPVEAEVVIAHPVVGAGDVAVDAKDQGNRVLGHGVGGVRRHANDRDAEFPGHVQVDVVETCGSQRDVTHTDGSEPAQRRLTHVVVDERAHRVASFGKWHCVRARGGRRRTGSDAGQIRPRSRSWRGRTSGSRTCTRPRRQSCPTRFG